MEPSICLSFEGDFEMTVDEFFGDPSDIPDQLTLESVVKIIESCSINDLVHDWNLVPNVTVTLAIPDDSRPAGYRAEFARIVL